MVGKGKERESKILFPNIADVISEGEGREMFALYRHNISRARAEGNP